MYYTKKLFQILYFLTQIEYNFNYFDKLKRNYFVQNIEMCIILFWKKTFCKMRSFAQRSPELPVMLVILRSLKIYTDINYIVPKIALKLL